MVLLLGTTTTRYYYKVLLLEGTTIIKFYITNHSKSNPQKTVLLFPPLKSPQPFVTGVDFRHAVDDVTKSICIRQKVTPQRHPPTLDPQSAWNRSVFQGDRVKVNPVWGSGQVHSGGSAIARCQ